MDIRDPRLVQVGTYVVVGGATALTDTLLTTLAYHVTRNMPFAVLVGYLAGLLVGYTFHKGVTFRSEAMNASSFRRYVVAAVGSYGLSLALVQGFKVALGSDEALVPKLASIPFVTIASFLVLKFWVFRESR